MVHKKLCAVTGWWWESLPEQKNNRPQNCSHGYAGDLVGFCCFFFISEKKGLKAFQAIINNDYNIIILYAILCVI